MSGNTFGKNFTITTAGESHGPALLAIVDGCPPGMELSEADLQPDIERRRTGTSRFTSQRNEPDQVKILSGVFEGKTTGTPIGLIIENTNQRPRDYNKIKELFRPGHADYTYLKKYGIRDYRGGGRSSARETVMRVAAAGIAKKYLREKLDINILGYLSAVGPIKADTINLKEIANNPFFFPDVNKLQALEDYITQLRRQGDSIGARVNVVAQNMPIGLGEPIFDRLDADVAKAMLSINAAKGVEIGAGFHSVDQHGSDHRDEMDQSGFMSNNAGGILGGISSGQDLEVSVAFKPTSSITKPGKTLNVAGEESDVITTGRHDPCVGIRAVPIVEAMLALVLMDHFCRHRAQNADVNNPT